MHQLSPSQIPTSLEYQTTLESKIKEKVILSRQVQDLRDDFSML